MTRCYAGLTLLLWPLSPCTVHSAVLHPAPPKNTTTSVLRSTELRCVSTEPVAVTLALAALAALALAAIAIVLAALSAALADDDTPMRNRTRWRRNENLCGGTAAAKDWKCNLLFKHTTSLNGDEMVPPPMEAEKLHQPISLIGRGQKACRKSVHCSFNLCLPPH
jgi:hypothetical protein